jgi:integrase
MFKDRDGWRVAWRQDGRRFSKKFTDKKEAQLFELQRDMGIANVAVEQARSPTFAEWSERWMRDYCRVEKAESQWRADACVIRLHLLPAFGKVRIVHLKKSHLAELKASLRSREKLNGGKTVRGSGKPLSVKSINNILALAKKMMATAVDFDLIPSNPFQGVKPLKLANLEHSYWRPDERDQFIERCRDIDPEFADLVVVACHTGLRLGELAALRWSDIDFARRKVHVARTWNFQLKKVIEMPKGKESADVALNQVALEVFGRLPKAGREVFSLALFHSARNRLGDLCELTLTRNIRFHDLRHTFASCLAMAGVDLMVIQKLMRHKSYQMTLRYAHLHPDHLAGATDVLCPRDSQMTRS